MKKTVFTIISFILFTYCFNYNLFAQENKAADSLLSENSESSNSLPNSISGTLIGNSYSFHWLFSGDYNLSDYNDNPYGEHEITDDEFEESFGEYGIYNEQEKVADPLYYFNYCMYSFNDVFYLYLLEPLSKGYKVIVPTAVRTGIANFFYNVAFPVRFVNNILQGKIKKAGTEAQIFIVNSSIGVLGLNRVAQTNFGLDNSNEDLGQTLGDYAFGNGFYIVWPFLGPSTLRDTFGLIGDAFLTPANYLAPNELTMGIKSFEMLNSASFRIGDYEALKNASLDPYVALRDAYINNRAKEVQK